MPDSPTTNPLDGMREQEKRGNEKWEAKCHQMGTCFLVARK
jgi:hypothetical protein